MDVVIMLTEIQHFRSNNIAVLLKPSPIRADSSGVLEKVKTYYVLALVNPDMKGGQLGKCIGFAALSEAHIVYIRH